MNTFSTTDGNSIYYREWGTTRADVVNQEVLQSLQQRAGTVLHSKANLHDNLRVAHPLLFQLVGSRESMNVALGVPKAAPLKKQLT